jgi:predicted alpha-1,2-mannosidase
MKGIRTFDIESAYEGMRKNAFPGGLMSKAGYEHHTCVGGGIEYYIERGYIPEGRDVQGPMHVDGAAQTLEYAYDDWCLAQLASTLGKEADYRQFIQRSENFKNLYNPASGFMQPRNPDGSWLEPFDPLSLTGWCESNGWQYTFYVPHDIQSLIRLMGGRDAFTKKLNHAFEEAVSMDFYARKPELHRDAAYVNYGNEPGRFVATLFNHCGAPWLSQKWSRQVQEQTFSSVEPAGFCEDDDNGLAAATSALLAIGLFDVRGGAAREPAYEITSPIFDKVIISLDKRFYKGDRFTIEAQNSSRANTYIQSAVLNDRPLDRPWFHHEQLASGGVLTLNLGPKPNRTWGTRPEDAPPSMSTDNQKTIHEQETDR